jgi:4-amino-4-deoxy-L-arabinose transferase-like glycosyltransferase
MYSITEKKLLLCLSVAALTLWLIFLGDSPLRDWDEGTIAQVARDIWQAPSGHLRWLYPTLAGEPYHNKPPLMHLLIAWAYSIGGVNEWTTRLPGAVITASGVPLLYLLGRLVFGRNLPAFFAALVYLTMLPVVRHGRLAMLDGTVITFFLLALYCLLKARHNQRYALGVGVSLGLIALTKGMMVFLLGGISGLFLLIDKQFLLLKSPYLWLGLFLGNVPAIAWHIAQWQYYGDNFLRINLQSQGFNRIVQSIEGHSAPPWYYLQEIFQYSFPWILFLPEGIYLAWKKRHTSWGCLILVGTIVYLVSISIMKTKIPWYVMPIYPFLALAIGAKLAEVWEHRQVKSKAWVVLLAILAIAGLGGCVYFITTETQPVLIAMSLILATSMAIVAWLVNKGDRNFIPVLFTGMYAVLFLFMSSQSWVWELNEAFPVKPVAALIRQHVPPGTKIYTSFTYGRPSLDFYCNCKVIPADLSLLQQKENDYWLIDNNMLEKVKLSGNQILGKEEIFTLVKTSIKS